VPGRPGIVLRDMDMFTGCITVFWDVHFWYPGSIRPACGSLHRWQMGHQQNMHGR
jgi:hypothetical protein